MEEIIYFGYGANSSSDMIGTLIDRKPKGFKAKLKNYSLHLQNWNEIPIKARKILKKNWSSNFKSYIAVPKKNAVVWGTAWYLTKKEREIIGLWEMHKLWYTPVVVKIEDEKGKILQAQTEIIKKTSCKEIKNSRYPKFPASKKDMLSVAKKVREIYLNKNK